jgi:hypothetical protein
MIFLPIAGLALGAAGMYLLDPAQGRRRRALIRDQALRRAREARHGADVALRDIRNRAGGARHRWAAGGAGHIPDRVLAERVRAKLGRYSSHPRAIKVSVTEGSVELSGPVLTQECETILRSVRRVRGVREVHERLQRHDSAAHVSSLQGGTPRSGTRAPFAQERWSPAARMLSGGAGSALLVTALRRGGIGGALAGLAGVGLLLRAGTNAPLERLATTRRRGRDDASGHTPDTGEDTVE